MRGLVVAALSAAVAVAQSLTGTRSVGNSISQGQLGTQEETLFAYAGGQSGLLTYLWFTGKWATFSQTRIRIYVDGETQASIDGALSLMHGVALGASPPPFAAELMGRGAAENFHSTFAVPFGPGGRECALEHAAPDLTVARAGGVRVTAQLVGATAPNDTEKFFSIVRGVVSQQPLPVQLALSLPPLPTTARLKLVVAESALLAPLAFHTLADIKLATGKGGAVAQVTLAAASGSLDYLEGCVRAWIDGDATATLLSSGTEDYFASAYYWDYGAAFAQFATEGLTSWAYNASDPAFPYSFSAYRVHSRDPLLFTESLLLTWRNGDVQSVLTGLKCVDNGPVEPRGDVRNSSAVSYAWIYLF
jgi:hypothetical protein